MLRQNIQKEFNVFLEKLKNNEYFSTLSYGDGEWSFIFDRRANSLREIYSKEFQRELIDALNARNFPNCYLTTTTKGYPKLTRKLKKLDFEKKELSNARLFLDTIISASNEDTEAVNLLKDLIRTLREKRIVMIGSESLKKVKEILDYDKFITTPKIGANFKRKEIEKEILDYGKPAVYCFSTGIVSNILISRLHDKLGKSSLIDFGSLWDSLLGIGTRKVDHWTHPLFNLKTI